MNPLRQEDLKTAQVIQLHFTIASACLAMQKGPPMSKLHTLLSNSLYSTRKAWIASVASLTPNFSSSLHFTSDRSKMRWNSAKNWEHNCPEIPKTVGSHQAPLSLVVCTLLFGTLAQCREHCAGILLIHLVCNMWFINSNCLQLFRSCTTE